MNDELEEPMRILKLGGTRLYIEPDQAGSYLLHSSDGTVIAAPFTRNDAARFARGAAPLGSRGGPAGLARRSSETASESLAASDAARSARRQELNEDGDGYDG